MWQECGRFGEDCECGRNVGGVLRTVNVAGMWAVQRNVMIGTERKTAQETQSVEMHKAADLWATES